MKDSNFTQSPLELLNLVPDLESFKNIFWHLVKGNERGIKNSRILKKYKLSIRSWGLIGQHYSQVQFQMLNNCFSKEELQMNHNYLNSLNQKYKTFWETYYNSSEGVLEDKI